MASSSWRDFERLVTAIERQLAPAGAEVRSPDHLLDKRTGLKREVDASIRYTVGSVPIVITLECRDRSQNEDVTWIEQLVVKREAIGATCTVAVSSKGFSAAALEVANYHSIETRLLHEISDDVIREWADKLKVLVTEGRYSLSRIGITLRATEAEERPKLSQHLQDVLAKSGMDAKIFTQSPDGAVVSVGELLHSAYAKSGQELAQGFTVTVPPKSVVQVPVNSGLAPLFEGITPNAGPIVRSVVLSPSPNQLTAESGMGITDVVEIIAELRVELRLLPAVFSRLLSYSGVKQIAKVAEARVRLSDGAEVHVISAGSNEEADTAV